jgi:DNA repair protein RadA
MKKVETIEDLPGCGEATAQKMRESGFKTLEQIAVASTGELMDLAGVGEATAAKMISAARDALDMGYENAEEILKRRQNIARITTGSKELDKLIGGGVETQNITEVYAKFSSGKTQLGFQLAVNVQMQAPQGLGGGCLWIDTESTFRPERVAAIAKAKGLDPEETLKNIFVGKAFNAEHQMLLVDKAEELIKERNIKLIVVDSLTSRFRSEFAGRGTLADRQQRLNRHLHTLQKIADMHNIAVYVTNQVMANPGLMFGDPTEPVGGNIVAHMSGTRVYLRKSKEEKRIARLVDSSYLPDGETVFKVTENGITDA